jgi:carbon storage regulator
MLVLTRKIGESISIGPALEVKVLAVHGGRVKLGFSGPPEIAVQRSEICDADRRFGKPRDRRQAAATV